MNQLEQLKKLYANRSKHSNYQILPSQLSPLLTQETMEVQSRLERERLDFILKNISIANKSVLDVGGNTGYFSFELLSAGAKSVHYYEGNREHAHFVKIASEVLDLSSKLKINNSYLSFEKKMEAQYDLVLLLNVLHHTGDDYGDAYSIEKARQQIANQLLSFKDNAREIVFQLGFNWKGDRNQCLFANGTKKEMIDFISMLVKDNFTIDKIGIAERKGKQIVYKDLNSTNIERDDSLGEFLNRPLFVLKRK